MSSCFPKIAPPTAFKLSLTCLSSFQRDGPDFLFFANNHSDKFADLKNSSTVQLTFQNSSSQDWASITGTASSSSSDPRIKELFGKSAAIWYGDLGDGVHNATADDPRVSLIELKPTYITHWKSTVGSVGFMKEAAVAAATGEVAVTGLNRRFEGKDIEALRKS